MPQLCLYTILMKSLNMPGAFPHESFPFWFVANLGPRELVDMFVIFRDAFESTLKISGVIEEEG